MKKLVIAEKPSVAADIARVLGKMRKVDDYYENDEFVVSSAVGHLVELCMPADIDKKYARWSMATLPIIPEKFTLKAIEKTKPKLKSLKSLMSRPDIDVLYNACDAGREGELIFTYVYEICKCKKQRMRLWFSSMTPDAIREAFANLRSQDEMESLQDAARCRSEADWLIGINGTRAVTTRMYGSRVKEMVSVGRVQTPTLAMIVERQEQIDAFQPKKFWKILADFKVANGEYTGVYIKPDFKADKDSPDKADRVWDYAQAEKILNEALNAKSVVATDKKTQSKRAAPRLYDLTTLQREANNRFSFPAGKTLSLTQSLYEKHKMVTYPRTDSRALPEDYGNVVLRTLSSLQGEYKPFAQRALDEKYVNFFNKKIFNNKQVSDHFAIIPTGLNSGKLSPDEAKIYDMIARRFIAAFYPEAVFDVTVRSTSCDGHLFKSEGKVLKSAGFLEVYNKQSVDDIADDNSGKKGENTAILPALTADSENATVGEGRIEEEFTKAPPRYTEATLLTAMETAGKLVDDEELAEAMKEKGLGTPATRAQIIETLISHKFVERQKRDLLPTVKAQTFITFLKTVGVNELTSPALTGDWEHKLRLIEKKELTRKDFMHGISDMTTHIVEVTKNFNEADADVQPTDIPSPSGDGTLLETFRSYKSKDGLFQIYKTIGNRKLSKDEVRELVVNKRIGPLTGFKSNKTGKPYDASLYIDDSLKIKFEFPNSKETATEQTPADFDISTAEVLGNCPSSIKNGEGSVVVETPTSYVCVKDGAILKDAFRLSKTMLSHKFDNSEVKELIEKGKTPLIEDFISKRTNKKFSAFLVLNEKGGVSFEFLPRAAKPAGEKKAAKATAKKPAKKSTVKRVKKADAE